MKNSTSMLLSGLGAGLMYLMDPDRGMKRRKVVRQKMDDTIETLHRTGETLSEASREISDRAARLSQHASKLAERVPALPWSRPRRSRWPLATKLALGGVGGALAVYGTYQLARRRIN